MREISPVAAACSSIAAITADFQKMLKPADARRPRSSLISGSLKVATLPLAVVLGSLAAYGLSRFSYRFLWMKNADISMYRAKELGRARQNTFDGELDPFVFSRLDADTSVDGITPAAWRGLDDEDTADRPPWEDTPDETDADSRPWRRHPPASGDGDWRAGAELPYVLFSEEGDLDTEMGAHSQAANLEWVRTRSAAAV